MRLFDAGARSTEPATVHDRVLTAANAITALRVLGLPVFVWLVLRGSYGIAFAVLAVVASTDWLDGYVARRFDQVTRLGRALDPLIDRAMLATAGLSLLAIGFLPLWVFLVVVGRDVALLSIGYAMFRGNPDIPVSRVGKFATACLLVGVPGFLLGHMDWPGAEVFLVGAYGFTLVGIAAYYGAAFRYWQAARVKIAMRGAATTAERGT